MEKICKYFKENVLLVVMLALEIAGGICAAFGIVWLVLQDLKLKLTAEFLFATVLVQFTPGILFFVASYGTVNKKHKVCLPLVSVATVLLIANIVLNFVLPTNAKYIKGIQVGKGNAALVTMNQAFGFVILIVGLLALAIYILFFILDSKEDKLLEEKNEAQ